MTIDQLRAQALAVKQAYDDNNQAAGRKKWDASDYMAGFVGDVGDLSKLIMAKQGLRPNDDIDAKLAHELSDCLWSMLILANELGIDIETAFAKNMHELHARVTSEK